MSHRSHRWSPYQPPGPFTMPVPVDPTGLAGPTPGMARGPSWVRTSPGRYVPSGTDRDRPEQRIAEAIAGAPDGAVVTGWASLKMRGAAFLDGRLGSAVLPVPLRIPLECHPRPRQGVRHVRRSARVPVGDIRGIACVGPLVAVFDAARLAPGLREAVVAIDMAAAARLVTVAEVMGLVRSRSWRGVPGVPQLREALPYASDGSASPPETRLRLVWELDARLPRPLVNPRVYDRRGRLLGVPDLLDPVAGLVVEYDGDDHRDPRRHSDDVDREAGFRGVGLEVTRVTGRDLRRTPALVHRLHTARGRAPFLPAADRAWVLGS